GRMRRWARSPSEDKGADRILTAETARFHFTYREQDKEQAMLIMSEADRAYHRVRGWLPGPDGDPIVADLTDTSREHLGIAGWKKLRLDLRPKSPALLRHVLYHETTHVLSARAGEPAGRQAALRFF